MDCYFHSNVPSVARCGDCNKPICGTCHAGEGNCPSCRLASRIDAAASTKGELPGSVRQSKPAPRARASVATMTDTVEQRALVALSYPLVPLALLALLDRRQSSYLRRQAIQSLAFNVGTAAFGVVLFVLGGVPFIQISAWILLGLLFPVYLVASIVYGIKCYNGEDFNIPIVSDWIDERLTAQERRS